MIVQEIKMRKMCDNQVSAQVVDIPASEKAHSNPTGAMTPPSVNVKVKPDQSSNDIDSGIDTSDSCDEKKKQIVDASLAAPLHHTRVKTRGSARTAL